MFTCDSVRQPHCFARQKYRNVGETNYEFKAQCHASEQQIVSLYVLLVLTDRVTTITFPTSRINIPSAIRQRITLPNGFPARATAEFAFDNKQIKLYVSRET